MSEGMFSCSKIYNRQYCKICQTSTVPSVKQAINYLAMKNTSVKEHRERRVSRGNRPPKFRRYLLMCKAI